MNRSPNAKPYQLSDAGPESPEANKFNTLGHSQSDNSPLSHKPESRNNFAATTGNVHAAANAKVNFGPAFDPRTVTSKVNMHAPINDSFRNAHREFNEEGEEIILTGAAYMGVDGSSSPNKQKSGARSPSVAANNSNSNSNSHNTQQTQHHSNSNNTQHQDSRASNTDDRVFSASRPQASDPLRQSTISFSGDDWRRDQQQAASKLSVHREELDEFENIESELTNMNQQPAPAQPPSGYFGQRQQAAVAVRDHDDTRRSFAHHDPDPDDDEHDYDNHRDGLYSSSYLSSSYRPSGQSGSGAASRPTPSLPFNPAARALNPNRQSRDDDAVNRSDGDEEEYEQDFERSARSSDMHHESRNLSREEVEDDDDEPMNFDASQSLPKSSRDTRPQERHDEFAKYDENYTSTLSSTRQRSNFDATASWGAVTQPAAVGYGLNSSINSSVGDALRNNQFNDSSNYNYNSSNSNNRSVSGENKAKLSNSLTRTLKQKQQAGGSGASTPQSGSQEKSIRPISTIQTPQNTRPSANQSNKNNTQAVASATTTAPPVTSAQAKELENQIEIYM